MLPWQPAVLLAPIWASSPAHALALSR